MSGRFHPSFEGVWKPERLADGFGEALSARVRSGLLPRAKPRRNRYELESHGSDFVRFRSTTLLTGANIGWNEVEVRVDRPAGKARYSVLYWTWARYCVFLGLGLLAFFALVFGLAWAWGTVSLATVSPGFLVFGAPMIAFWCLLWPWILVAMHKKHAKAGFENLLAEVNDEALARAR